MLWRAKSDIDLPVLEVLPDGTYLSRIADPAASRRMRRRARSQRHPRHRARVIEYSVTSSDGTDISETFTTVTDITDPAALSAEQAADAYARRWQLENSFDELGPRSRGGAAVVLRSNSPPMIRQEIYAMLCCYQAIRTLISHAADDAGLYRCGSPSPSYARPSAAASATPDAFPPQLLDELAADLAAEITYHRHLVPRRPGRRYERKTKRPEAAQDPQARRGHPAHATDEGRLSAVPHSHST